LLSCVGVNGTLEEGNGLKLLFGVKDDAEYKGEKVCVLPEDVHIECKGIKELLLLEDGPGKCIG